MRGGKGRIAELAAFLGKRVDGDAPRRRHRKGDVEHVLSSFVNRKGEKEPRFLSYLKKREGEEASSLLAVTWNGEGGRTIIYPHLSKEE